MEGTQTIRRRRKSSAVIAVLAAAALLCTGRPALAQPEPPDLSDEFQLGGGIQVAPNGVGDLLIFQYWTTVNRDTLIAITNPFGPAIADPDVSRFVHVRLREGVASREVLDFTICLSPGDVWTAAITPGNTDTTSLLIVGNPGSCDDQVSAFSFTAPPLPGQQVGVAANFGYITAYTMECSRTLTGPLNCPTNIGTNNGGDDAIMGIATPLNVEAGFASSYNATAIVGFDALSEAASILSQDGSGTRAPFSLTVPAPGPVGEPVTIAEPDPCGRGVGIGFIPGVGVGCRGSVTRAIAREGGVDKEILLARWTASPEIDSVTQFVLTFPGDLQPAADPVSLWVWNEDEAFNFSPREITLPWEVNRCTFQNGLTTPSGNTELACDGEVGLGGESRGEILGPGGTFTGGWFRILNNNDVSAVDGIGDGSGIEFDSLDAPPDSRFPVLTLVFSFFQGLQGIFDQSYPMQWAAIIGSGGMGGPTCTPLNENFPAGCRSFNIAGADFKPWFVPPGAVCSLSQGVPIGDSILGPLSLLGIVNLDLFNICFPGDNINGALNRTGTLIR